MKNSTTLKVKEISRKKEKKPLTDITFKKQMCSVLTHFLFYENENLELEVMEVVVCFFGLLCEKRK